MSGWSGRKVPRLVELTLTTKGRLCWLCELDGADSADHDPPRSELVRLGVPDPDAPGYLFPAHRTCNNRRNDRPVTPDLKADLKRRRLADLTRLSGPTLSPVLARRAPAELRRDTPS